MYILRGETKGAWPFLTFKDRRVGKTTTAE